MSWGADWGSGAVQNEGVSTLSIYVSSIPDQFTNHKTGEAVAHV